MIYPMLPMECLPEKDEIGFEDLVVIFTPGRTRTEIGVFGIVRGTAFQTDQSARISVKLIDIFTSCHLVQVVYVLGDNCLEKAGFLHFGQRKMSAIGLGFSEEIIEDFQDKFPAIFAMIQEIADIQNLGIVF